MAEIVLIRHGQTEWSANGRHTSYTDLDLTEAGIDQARAVGERLAGRRFAEVISSPRVITANQQEAVIRQGQEIGYVTYQNSGAAGSTPTASV